MPEQVVTQFSDRTYGWLFAGKCCCVMVFVGYCVITYNASFHQFWVGPLWLIGRGETPAVIGILVMALFAILALGLLLHKSRCSFVLSTLLIPAWLLTGAFVVNLADW